jgi:hypothetical protein
MVWKSYTSAERISTNPETIERHPTLAVVTSIAGVDKLYKTAGLENTMTPPRKPENVPRRVIRVGIPETDKVDTWVSFNNLLAGDETLTEEAARILRAAPK